jgi:hypothetical protein
MYSLTSYLISPKGKISEAKEYLLVLSSLGYTKEYFLLFN